MPVRPTGPVPARIMIVGEAPGEQEVQKGEPFVGASGAELNKMLHEAGIMRSECFITNVCRERPPGNKIEAFIPLRKKDVTPAHVSLRDKKVLPVIKEGYDLLLKEIALVRPNVILAFGNVALWALTGRWAITSWRGSLLALDLPGLPRIKVIPAMHPAAILRQWTWRWILVHDLKRAAREMVKPDFPSADNSIVIAPQFEQAMSVLLELKARMDGGEILRIAADIETRGGYMTCIGIGWSMTQALCIPLTCSDKKEGYWTEEEEAALMYALYLVLTHSNVEVIGQNFLYDSQYFYRHLHYIPRCKRDTMLAQHAMFSNVQKSLDFLASIYCENYTQWKSMVKDEGLKKEA